MADAVCSSRCTAQLAAPVGHRRLGVMEAPPDVVPCSRRPPLRWLASVAREKDGTEMAGEEAFRPWSLRQPSGTQFQGRLPQQSCLGDGSRCGCACTLRRTHPWDGDGGHRDHDRVGQSAHRSPLPVGCTRRSLGRLSGWPLPFKVTVTPDYQREDQGAALTPARCGTYSSRCLLVALMTPPCCTSRAAAGTIVAPAIVVADKRLV